MRSGGDGGEEETKIEKVKPISKVLYVVINPACIQLLRMNTNWLKIEFLKQLRVKLQKIYIKNNVFFSQQIGIHTSSAEK